MSRMTSAYPVGARIYAGERAGRRNRPARDRSPRARTPAAPAAGRSPVHAGRAGVRARPRAPWAAPCRALLREGDRRQGAAPRRLVVAGHRGRRRATRRPARRAVRAGRRARRLADPLPDDGRRRRDPAMSLPAWLTPLLVADEMRATDKWAIEQRGTPGMELMERAGDAV